MRKTRASPRVCACFAAWAAASTSWPARAAPPKRKPERSEAVAPSSLSEAAELTRAKQLYREGQAKFETFDYVGAIDLWTKAYSELPENPTNRAVRARLLFNIAAARVAAYDIDHSAAHLRQAKRLMDKYLESIESTYGPDGGVSVEAREALEWMQKIDTLLEELDAREAELQAEAAAERAATEPEPKRRPVDEGPQRRKNHKALTIAGGVVGGLGVGMLGVMTMGLLWGRAIEREGARRVEEDPMLTAADLRALTRQGETMNILTWVGAAAGGAMLVTGAILLGLGLSRPRARTAAVPWIGPASAGVALGGRF